MECSICYCEVLRDEQVVCGDGHLFCGTCTATWVDSLDVPMLKGKCCSSGIRCPFIGEEQCHSTIHMQDISRICEDFSVVERLAERAERAFKYFVEDGLETLSIRCPRATCKVLLDLNPDACAAIVCGNCGQNFCSCCHCRFSSNQQAHVHVPLAHNWQDVFLPRDVVHSGQQRLRLVQLSDFIADVRCTPVVDAFFETVGTELADLGLPKNSTEFAEASDAARAILNQQTIGVHEPLEAVHEEFDPDNDDPITPEARLGREILQLCFERKYAELQVLYHSSLAEGRTWDVDWFQRSPDGNNSFNIAARAGSGVRSVAYMQTVLSLGAGESINELDSDGFNALHRFILLNDSESVKLLLRQTEINVEAETREGRTPLFLCAEARHIHFARDLLRKGAYLHTTSDSGQTVLMAVSLRCQLDTLTSGELVRNLKFWIDAGADLEVPDGQAAWRALHYAACGRYGNSAVAINVLLRAGAQVSSRNRFGQSPLQVAVCFGNLEGIRALVAAEGASPSIPFDSEEKHLLNADHEARREEITAALKEAQAAVRRQLARTEWARGLWREYGPLFGVALGMGLIAVLLKPMQAFFARLR